MKILKSDIPPIIEHILPWLVLTLLLLYTYAKFFQHPYTGIRWDSSGEIVLIYVNQDTNAQPRLETGDRLIQVDSAHFSDFQADLRQTIFNGYQAGDMLQLLVERNGQQLAIPWKYPGPNRDEIMDLAISEGWLAFFFWLAGTLTLLVLRPKDERWKLMVAFNYLTATWLILGSGVSFFHIWQSALLLRMSVWLSVPVYLHLHWVFPQTLGKLPKWLVWGGYASATLLAAAEWFQLLPKSLYLLGFVSAIGGTLVLIVAHAVRQPETRRDFRLLLIVAMVTLAPPTAVGLIGTFTTVGPFVAGGTILGLPLLPFAYFYAAYRRQLGGLEVRINQIISIYIFMILLGSGLLLLIALASLWLNLSGPVVAMGLVAAIIAAVAIIWGLPPFQLFVEQRLLGMPVAPKNLQGTYSTRITTSTSLASLAGVIEKEILPSLLVRQFVFIKFDKDSQATLLAVGVTPQQVPEGHVRSLLNETGKYRPAAILAPDAPCAWVRLALPLKIEDELIGFWLFGRRDPDDLYSQAEIAILQSLANQTAIALSYILQAEHLRVLYHANINRHDQERLHLALELHDSILNQLALLMMNLEDNQLTPAFQVAFDTLTQKLRGIVSNLRPPMLNYGVKPALEDLADHLMERNDEKISVVVEIDEAGHRYGPHIEQHLFRIIQEACENTLRHAGAKQIKISGKLEALGFDLGLEDDGAGFEAGAGLDLNALLANKHFGLAGMYERANLIGAKITINSAPQAGTQIRILWSAPEQA